MPSFFAHFFAVGRERDAIARISMSFDFIMPGRTFSQPMRAVEITPQRTGFFTARFAISLPPRKNRGRQANRSRGKWQGVVRKADRISLAEVHRRFGTTRQTSAPRRE